MPQTKTEIEYHLNCEDCGKNFTTQYGFDRYCPKCLKNKK